MREKFKRQRFFSASGNWGKFGKTNLACAAASTWPVAGERRLRFRRVVGLRWKVQVVGFRF